MGKLQFTQARGVQVKLSQAQRRAIQSMYKDVAKDIAKDAEKISNRTNVSSILRSQYLKGLSKQISQEIEHIGAVQKTSIRANMFTVAKEVVAENNGFLKQMGIDIEGAYSHVPRDVVNRIATGQVYEGNWSLNKAIWGNTKKTQQDINRIIAKGVAEQKSTYDIAKDLETYVNPAKKKAWDWGKVYPGTARVVDYNAQRLARTMLSHAYEQSFVRVTKNNPFIEYYEWVTANSERTCEVCMERAYGYHGVIVNGEEIAGAYYKNELPMDHPNGMCDFFAVTENLEDVGAELADWVNGKSDKEKEIDAFAKDLGYTPKRLKKLL